MLSTPRLAKPVVILLIEDNPGDVELTLEALNSSKMCNEVHVVADGDEAMAFLQRQGKHATAPHPDLILLDLNLPGRGGREVLTDIKGHERFKSVPVVILTSSAAEEDVLRSYELGANCYVTKPLDLDGFLKVVREIQAFWLGIVMLPSTGGTL